MAWRRQPEPVVPVVVDESVTHGSPESVAPKPKRRSKAQRLNDEIERQQLALAEREKELVQVRRRLAAEWEAGRPREPVGMDYGRFTY